MNTSLVQLAGKYFDQRDYVSALCVYRNLSYMIGDAYFAFNLQLCRKYLSVAENIDVVTQRTNKYQEQISGIVTGERVLVVTNKYPQDDALYSNYFVHERVKEYQRHGIQTEVFRFQEASSNSYHVFDGVEVVSGAMDLLELTLATGKYSAVFIHFLTPAMWSVLKNFPRCKIFVWIHGAEIQPYHRRQYNYPDPVKAAQAQIASAQRLDFWRELLRESRNNIKYIFVSQTFADEVMEDLGFTVPKSEYTIIHNPIDTETFVYAAKGEEQRGKILSIQSYASAKYANDLSVQAILQLSGKPFFSELEFRMIGDGPLFNETLEPLRAFPNVIYEQRVLSHREIAELHKQYGVFLCPTRWDSQGVSRGEAMSSGLVPVTNAVGAVTEFVDAETGVLANAEDAAGLAEGITRLYEQPEEFLDKSRNAAKRIRMQCPASLTTLEELNLFLPPTSKIQYGDIHIVFICDQAYALPTYVAISSILMNRSKTCQYVVHVLGVDLLSEQKAALNSIMANNFHVVLHEMQNEYKGFAFSDKDFHVSPAAILKFKLPEIFAEYDKILYLDGDIVVQNDLYDLYNTKLGNAYAAVVKDIKPMYQYKPSILEKLDVKYKIYFNSGVMLLNLDQLRKNHVSEKLFSYRRSGINFFMDQDALNVVLADNVIELEIANNLLITLDKTFSFDEIKKHYKIKRSSSNFADLLKEAKILHYSSSVKPWSSYASKYAKIWYDYYQLAKTSEKDFGAGCRVDVNMESSFYKYLYSDSAGCDILPCMHNFAYVDHAVVKKKNINMQECNIDIADLPVRVDAGMRHQEEIIVSLTSYPRRMWNIAATLYSLVNQTLKPDKICLWLAADEFGESKEMPADVRAMLRHGLEIRWVEHSLRSYTKLVPSLELFPDSLLVTVDDDIFYPKQCLQSLYEAYRKDPVAIHALRAKAMIYDKGTQAFGCYNDAKIVKTDCTSFYNLQTGVGGVLYPPNSLHKEVSNSDVFMRVAPYADDLWFWAMALRQGTKIHAVQPAYTDLIFTNIDNEYGENTLSSQNVHQNMNDIQLANILQEFDLYSCLCEETETV